MAKVITPNILITNNYDIIKNLFIDSPGLLNSNISKLPESSNYLLISPKSNSYLESFEYSISYDKPDLMVLNITLIDIDNTLENKLFLTPAEVQINKAVQAVNNATNTNTDNSVMDSLNILDSQHIFYVSFGVDADINNWSEPRSFYLYRTIVDITNTGIRKYKLSMYPSNSVLFKPKLRYNLEKPNQEKEFLFTDYSSELNATTPIVENESPSIILYKLLKNYIKLVCNESYDLIIGIMPDLSNLSVSGKSESGQVTTSSIGFSNIDRNTLSEDSFKKTFGIQIKNLEDAKQALFTKLTTLPGMTPMATQDAAMELSNKTNYNSPNFEYWCIKAEKSTNSNGLNPNLPNWYFPINKINNGLKTTLGKLSINDDLIITEENSVKLIKFWSEIGLIKVPENKPLPKRIIIFGLETMVDRYLYNSTHSGNSQSQLNQYFTNPKPSNNLLSIVSGTNEKYLETSSAKYFEKFTTLMSKQKISSDFQEELPLDELALDDSSKDFKYLKNIGIMKNTLKAFDIPVFTNNIKNSNIIQLSMDSSDQYFAGLNIGIRSNALKFYFDAIQQNLNKLNIGNLEVSSVVDEYGRIITQILDNGDIVFRDVGASGVEDRTSNYTRVFDLIKKLVIDQIAYAKKISKGGSGGFFEDQPKDFTTLNPQEQLQVILNSDLLFQFDYTETQPDYSNTTEFGEPINRWKKGPGISPENKKLFEAIKKTGLLEQFGKLILESNGDLDYQELLFALAARNLTMPNISFSKDYDPAKVKEALDVYWEEKIPGFNNTRRRDVYVGQYNNLKQEYDAYLDLISLKRQQNNYEYANLMFQLFKPEYSDTRSKINKSYAHRVHNDFFNFVPRSFDLSQDSIMAELEKYVNNQAYKLTLKTLPFFHIDSPRAYLFKPCIVISKRLKGLNTNSNITTSNYDFFTGVYNIYGFKHVITPTECYSLFSLTKKTGVTITGL